MKNNTENYYSPKQGRLPLFITDVLDICDPELTFDRIMEEIKIAKYLKPEPFRKLGRPGYNRVNMLKTVLFGFMDTGYASLRELEDIDNLLDNAVIHGNCTQIHITAQQQGNRIQLIVHDNGRGMSEEQQKRAFDRYFTSGEKSSTGLGLSITAAIIREHGGEIQLSSEEGKGVAVTMLLPVHHDLAEQE